MKMYLRIRDEVKKAMISKDTVKRDVLKMVIDKAKMSVKEKNPTVDVTDIPNDIIIQSVNKEIKQLNQTKDSLIGREDSDLYKETIIKIGILSEYLPKMMSQTEVDNEVIRILKNIDSNVFGVQMKSVMSELKGKADNNMIKNAVERYRAKGV